MLWLRYLPLTQSSLHMQIVIIAHLILLNLCCQAMASNVAFASSSSIRIATYNIRFDSMPDDISVERSLAALPHSLISLNSPDTFHEQPWSTRRGKIVQQLIHEVPVLVGAYITQCCRHGIDVHVSLPRGSCQAGYRPSATLGRGLGMGAFYSPQLEYVRPRLGPSCIIRLALVGMGISLER